MRPFSSAAAAGVVQDVKCGLIEDLFDGWLRTLPMTLCLCSRGAQQRSFTKSLVLTGLHPLRILRKGAIGQEGC